MKSSHDAVQEVRLSLRLPSGRPFSPTAEAELFEHLLHLARSMRPAKGRLLAIPELVGPFGVADLVSVVDPKNVLDRRLQANIPPLLNRNDADIVSVLSPRYGRTVEDVAAALFLSDVSIVRRRIPVLLRSGAVERTSTGVYRRNPSLLPVGRIHAFEAKVRDWRGGMDQARTYALWADSATVVISSLPRDLSTIRSELRRWSLGLAQKSEWLFRPRIRRHTAGRRLWATEHVVAAIQEM